MEFIQGTVKSIAQNRFRDRIMTQRTERVIEGHYYQRRKMNYVEKLVHNTRNNKAIYVFDDKFYKFPSYLRRSAITKAIGIVSSYMSQIENWKANDCKGAMPKLDTGNHLMPCFYKDNMFDYQDDETYIKVYRNNDWVWQEIRLNHSDLNYIENKAPLDS